MAAASRSPSRLSVRLITCDCPTHGALNSGRRVTISSAGRALIRFTTRPNASRLVGSEALHATGLTALVGREEELELLQRRWSKLKTGEGQVVLLSGEAGIGKSRLTAALLERLTVSIGVQN